MKEIQLNQSLHGYKNGHQLLACSMELSPQLKKILLFQSDLSGSNLSKGFENYITGFPLEGSNFYAFSKTWYANEMKRPGCVWTHTLLINSADLNVIPEFQNLLRYFVRPVEGEYSSYNSLLKIGKNELDENNNYKDGTVARERLLDALFNYPDKTILIPSSSSQKYEETIISIWSDLWPGLRKNFSFCTGALGLKTLAEHEFDIQVIPQSSTSTIERQSKNPLTIDLNEKVISNWANVFNTYSKHNVRSFLWTFGDDIENNRSSFKPLIELFIFFSDNYKNLSVEDILKILSEKYPLATQATNLKTTLLSTDINNYAFTPKLQESDILFGLSVTSNYKSFNYIQLRLNERFKSFYYKDMHETLNIVSRLTNELINSHGEDAIKVIANNVTENDILYIRENYKKLLPLFGILNPKLIYYKSFWNITSNEQQEIFSTLLKVIGPTNIEWHKLVPILIEVDASIDVELLNESSISLAPYILDWIDNFNRLTQKNFWIRILWDNPREIITWLNSHSNPSLSTLELVLSILNPNSKLVINNGTGIWLKLLSNNKISINEPVSLRLKAFTLALAFNNPDAHSFELINYSFERIYIALLNDALPYDLWKNIEVHTKALFLWNDWDKCKKLANALTDKASKYHWPKNRFYELFSTRRAWDSFRRHI